MIGYDISKEDVKYQFLEYAILDKQIYFYDFKLNLPKVDKIIEIGDNTLDFFEAVVEDLNNPALLLIKGIRTIGRIVKTNRRI